MNRNTLQSIGGMLLGGAFMLLGAVFCLGLLGICAGWFVLGWNLIVHTNNHAGWPLGVLIIAVDLGIVSLCVGGIVKTVAE